MFNTIFIPLSFWYMKPKPPHKEHWLAHTLNREMIPSGDHWYAEIPCWFFPQLSWASTRRHRISLNDVKGLQSKGNYFIALERCQILRGSSIWFPLKKKTHITQLMKCKKDNPMFKCGHKSCLCNETYRGGRWGVVGVSRHCLLWVDAALIFVLFLAWSLLLKRLCLAVIPAGTHQLCIMHKVFDGHYKTIKVPHVELWPRYFSLLPNSVQYGYNEKGIKCRINFTLVIHLTQKVKLKIWE